MRSSLGRVRDLKQLGHFSEALKALSENMPVAQERTASDVLRVELLEHCGHPEAARVLASRLLSSKYTTGSQRSVCEFTLGRIAVAFGPIDEAIAHFQRAASYARECNDLEGEFDARIQLLHHSFERMGASASLLSDVRTLAMKLGDARSTAKLHLFVGVMEARRGLLSNAKRHLGIALRLLEQAPHAYLECFAENMALGISIIESRYAVARRHGSRAMELAQETGIAVMLRAVTGNLGHLYYALGEFHTATAYLQQALMAGADQLSGPINMAALEGLARIYLCQARLSECQDALDVVENCTDDQPSYFCRDAAVTRAHLLAKQHRLSDAIAKTDLLTILAARSGDSLAAKKASLAKADFLERCGHTNEALALLESTVPSLVGDSPELFAYAEQILASALVREGNAAAAEAHHNRAKDLCATTESVTAGQMLEERWQRSLSAVPTPPAVANESASSIRQSATRMSMHAIASAIAHSGRPEIAARELQSLLIEAGCVDTASVISISQPDEAAHCSSRNEQFVEIGHVSGHRVGLSLRRNSGAEVVAMMASTQILIDALQKLVQARAEREERITLWPVEELSTDGASSVVTGHMRDLMSYAHRVAGAPVNVLITGESGTGKEIIARAIHGFSARAQKPFVPFNCTAVPHDLLESQLFGYRRGAFTGADRDNIGLIRSALGGTLFLDEIGELGLELQPKLLRFLESGEIATLGELRPQRTDVRIIAATNTNLEDAVSSGKFREDLFYRLNVVRLSIRPLRERRDEIPNFVHHFVARAADEFKKGRITITEETMERLLLYRWPGNVRQLQNEVRRIVALAEPNSTITPDAIDPEILGALPLFRRAGVNGGELCVSLKAKLIPTLVRIEREMIRAAFKEHDGKVNAVAKALGISRKGLYLKRQRLGL